MSQYVADKHASPQIERRDQLVEYFAASVKPREQWRIGTEYEKVAVRRSTGHAVPFSGEQGIERLLMGLADRFGWEPVEEEGRVVALKGAESWITLEPGGQVELSGAICANVHQARRELDQHVDEIVAVGDALDIAFLPLGLQPLSRLDEIEWVPKKRYRIMGPYMLRVGTLGQRMMKQTAGVQVNLDYGSEADAMRKVRVGMGLTPLLTAMFANSPLLEGDLNGFATFRGHIWTDTDNARCGLLPFIFRESASFEHYVDYVLDVPMYFIVRGEQWYEMTAHTFREFMQNGHQGHRATMADWIAHLTTLFYETRLKSYLEIRCADSQPPELMVAVPALVKGVFYEDDCLEAAWDLIKRWTWEERLAAYHDAHRRGLQAKVKGIAFAELARELIAIAEEGLRRQHALDERDQDETIHLDRIRELVRRGLCPADLVIEKWKGAWGGDVRRMIGETAYG